MSGLVTEACRFASSALAAAADPSKAEGMQAYMKTDMPFYGVQKPARAEILRDLVRSFPPRTGAEYEELVVALWQLPHREEKYLALGAARHFREFVARGAPAVPGSDRGGRLVGPRRRGGDSSGLRSCGGHPEAVWPTVDTWIDDDDMWLRRTAIICQVGAKEDTDAARLFRFCEARASRRNSSSERRSAGHSVSTPESIPRGGPFRDRPSRSALRFVLPGGHQAHGHLLKS